MPAKEKKEVPSAKEILAKYRGPGETWLRAHQKMFEEQIRVLLMLNEKLKQRASENEESYRKKISEGTRKGLEQARRRHVKLGGSRGRKSKVDLKRLRELRRRGFTQQQIAGILNCSQVLVSKLLRRKSQKRGKR